MGKTLR